jgi:hypothetical protein
MVNRERRYLQAAKLACEAGQSSITTPPRQRLAHTLDSLGTQASTPVYSSLDGVCMLREPSRRTPHEVLSIQPAKVVFFDRELYELLQ